MTVDSKTKTKSIKHQRVENDFTFPDKYSEGYIAWSYFTLMGITLYKGHIRLKNSRTFLH